MRELRRRYHIQQAPRRDFVPEKLRLAEQVDGDEVARDVGCVAALPRHRRRDAKVGNIINDNEALQEARGALQRHITLLSFGVPVWRGV